MAYRLIFLLSWIVLSSCSKEMMISNPSRPVITPSRLEVHGDKIAITVTSTVTNGTLPSNVKYQLIPVLSFDDHEINLEPLLFQGSKKSTTESKSYLLPYQDRLEKATLEVRGDFESLKTGEKERYRLPLSSTQGAITTSRLILEGYKPHFMTEDLFIMDEDTTRFDFVFAIGGSTVLEQAQNKQLLTNLEGLMKSDRVILKSSIIGTHSPTGSDEVNRRLAAERAQSVRELFTQLAEKHVPQSYEDLSAQTEVEFNSWKILQEKMEGTSLSEETKRAISNLISNNDDYQTIKTGINRLPESSMIISEVFPRLQMSRLEIISAKQISDQQIIEQLSTEAINGELQLNTDKILALARVNKRGSQRLQLYNLAERSGKSAELYNDWAATYLEAFKLWDRDRSETHLVEVYRLLDMAKDLSASPEISANLGIANSIAGRYDLAQSYFDRAGNGRAGYSQGIYELKAGHYAESVKHLEVIADSSFQKSYNLGLAKLLDGNYKEAIGHLSQALELGSDSAMTNYTLAIAANRSNNRNLTTKYLAEAFRINPRYNDYFHKDYEFENINKVLFPRYPDSLKIPVRNYKRPRTVKLPSLLLASGNWSYRKSIIDGNDRNISIAEAREDIERSLKGSGWKSTDIYCFTDPTDGGVYLLTGMEMIDDSGYSMFDPERWSHSIDYRGNNLIDEYKNSLITAEPGRYRFLVIGLEQGEERTDLSIEYPNCHFSSSEIVSNVRLEVYEFKKHLDGKTDLVSDSGIDHLSRTGLSKRSNP